MSGERKRRNVAGLTGVSLGRKNCEIRRGKTTTKSKVRGKRP